MAHTTVSYIQLVPLLPNQNEFTPCVCVVQIIFGNLTFPVLKGCQKQPTWNVPCGVKISTTSIHWDQESPGRAVQHLLHISSHNTVTMEADIPLGKLEADKTPATSISTLTVHCVGKGDSATYYCVFWEVHSGRCEGLPKEPTRSSCQYSVLTTSYIVKLRRRLCFCRSCNQCDRSYWIKTFGKGTKLTVTPSGRSLPVDISPKPTIFLPSVAEINLHNAGTFLCLLEKFFPDVIKVYWKEKNGNRILESQQGNTMKTNDTYTKFSWLTVTGRSMDKEHRCIVQHENNIGGVDQEILFPSVNKEVTAMNSTKACLRDESNTLQLQLTSTSAYYIYLLLLLVSVVYFAIIAFCLLRRTAVCGSGKSS
ncbi:PREDICTED: uncharacterized protein LOC101395712 [Ceratotherium simum simum]|uniref:Uncharacterized protein LOC101395712 n=1 Tax=Ceratotherium simum simum TaxID=73337 RepID=A0ABM1DDQ5_CERSS|nr:PREDICTED: uncharacterized protein LOC101395712 [Ceratotherium simum simum]